MMRFLFRDATVVNPDSVEEGCHVLVDNGTFEAVGKTMPSGAADAQVDLVASGWYLYPSLINIHDHLRGSWLPRCGNGPYQNVYQWLDELHVKKVFEPARERDKIPEKYLYMLGTYKNLLSGVTTVVDHYLRLEEDIYRDLPIRIIRKFGREGVVRTFHDPESHPPWGEGILKEYSESVGKQPFVIHVEEGFDEETGTELRRLDRLGILGSNTVLIHGIGFDEEDIQIVKRKECHMVWCPATHEFLYGRTGNIPRWLEVGISASLGTDSSLTGALNMFEEMRTAKRVYSETFGAEIDSRTLFQMVTSNPAKALMRGESLGRIQEGYEADLLVLERHPGRSPLETLLDARPQDVVLLLQDGRARFGDERLAHVFETGDEALETSAVSVVAMPKRIVGDPVGLMRVIWEKIGRRYTPEFLPIDEVATQT